MTKITVVGGRQPTLLIIFMFLINCSFMKYEGGDRYKIQFISELHERW